MHETKRTLAFVGVAVVSLVAAILAGPSLPDAPEEFSAIGEPFYPDFHPGDAQDLRVVGYDEDTASVKLFTVQFKDGLWRIPSHHNYPADGADRLARTAASVVGIERQGLASRFESEHEEFGVVDPLDEGKTTLKGRGQRITLKDGEGNVLADYIIGKQVEGRPQVYYVRRPDEKQTYLAKLDIDLSTKFADWIEADVLKLDRDKLTEIVVNKYSIEETRGRIVDPEVTRLSRAKSSDPWKLEGLNEATEELDTEAVNETVSSLDDLKIVGVRPKPHGLSQDLKLAEGIKVNTPTMLDLQARGFLFARGPGGGQQLVSKQGELVAGINDGVEYILYFGDVFTGSDLEIESGFASDKQKQKEGEAPSEEKKADDLQKSRYLFVMASFNESHLGEAPQKPEPPSDTVAPEQEAEAADDESAEPEDAAEQDAEETPAEKPAAETPAKDLQKEYETALKAYEDALKQREEKVKQGQQRAKELNERFADWYYVISAESFDKLRLSRRELIKEKTKPESTDGAEEPSAEPTTDTPPEAAPSDQSEQPAEAKPATPTDPPATSDEAAAGSPESATPKSPETASEAPEAP